jgi:hypothetical protein
LHSSEESDYWTVDKGCTPLPDKVSDADLGIMNLYINGEVLAVKRSTLCFDPQSKLAQDFSDDAWLEERWIVTETGKRLVLIELPARAFKQMVYELERMVIAEDRSVLQNVPPLLGTATNLDDKDYVRRVLMHCFSADHHIIKPFLVPDNMMDSSVIITDSSDKLKIKEWLKSANKTSKPKLLYRASRDGWNAANFHRECDNKGATLTVVKSSGGYIFGGYSSAPWNSSYDDNFCASKDAFLFSLKCYEGLSAVKMSVTNNHSQAIYCYYSDYGPTFGGRHDLKIASNANTNKSSYSYIGHTYSLPPGTTNLHFLTGQKNFQVSEYEVFQV